MKIKHTLKNETIKPRSGTLRTTGLSPGSSAGHGLELNLSHVHEHMSVIHGSLAVPLTLRRATDEHEFSEKIVTLNLMSASRLH
jgi:hypothetical protein